MKQKQLDRKSYSRQLRYYYIQAVVNIEVEVIIHGEDSKEFFRGLRVCVCEIRLVWEVLGCWMDGLVDWRHGIMLYWHCEELGWQVDSWMTRSDEVLEFRSQRVNGHLLLLEFIEFLNALSFFLFLLCLFLQGIPLLNRIVEIPDNFAELIAQEFIHGFP